MVGVWTRVTLVWKRSKKNGRFFEVFCRCVALVNDNVIDFYGNSKGKGKKCKRLNGRTHRKEKVL